MDDEAFPREIMGRSHIFGTIDVEDIKQKHADSIMAEFERKKQNDKEKTRLRYKEIVKNNPSAWKEGDQFQWNIVKMFIKMTFEKQEQDGTLYFYLCEIPQFANEKIQKKLHDAGARISIEHDETGAKMVSLIIPDKKIYDI